MILYLVQHGEAISEEVNPERPLTEKGKKDVTKVANFLKNSNPEIGVIWHSTKRRAVETADILSSILSPKRGTVQKEGLAPNDTVREVFTTVESEKDNLMIVGHLPFLQRLASLALAGSEDRQIVSFRQGGLLCLKKIEGIWQVMFAITPDLLK